MQGPPLSIIPPNILRKIAPMFDHMSSKIAPKIPKLKLNLEKANIKLSPIEYVSMSLASSFFNLIVLGLMAVLLSTKGFTTIDLSGSPTAYVSANIEELSSVFGVFMIALILSTFILIQQMMYPKLKAYEKIKKIDKNIIPALQHILIQLNSGAPLFDSLVGVSSGDYGEVSKEFKSAIRKIHAGKSQIVALEEVAEKNPSPHFKSAIWQITTGMKTGSDVTKVLENTIEDLSEEQVIQIQKYGGQLNPLAMFYMMIAVIIPSLGITFIMIISAMASIPNEIVKYIFIGMAILVLFMQIMFLGAIKSRRPNLLE